MPIRAYQGKWGLLDVVWLPPPLSQMRGLEGVLSLAILVFNNFLTAVLIRTRIQELTLMVSSLTGPTGCGLCCTR
ncbi:MAG: hypothetical protein AUG45_01915 [Ktedonobacter sp. 13_1_20CM_3_54_15]|nr:MAG: hypothetical protein AUG45_01915 [Ktedonobacter sp. 13_1_20CM_3_54_15]